MKVYIKKTDFEEALDKALGNDSAPFSEDTTDKIGDLASDMMACLISTQHRAISAFMKHL